MHFQDQKRMNCELDNQGTPGFDFKIRAKNLSICN